MVQQSKWQHEGASAPFFDRFKDGQDGPRPGDDQLYLDKHAYLESIEIHVAQLLNTRCPLPLDQYQALIDAAHPHTYPKLYGLPDFSFYDGSNEQSWPVLRRYIQNALRLFEPRLYDTTVKVHTYDREAQSLTLTITGDVKMGSYIIPVSFAINVDNLALKQHPGIKVT